MGIGIGIGMAFDGILQSFSEAYSAHVIAHSPTLYYRCNDDAGSTVVDESGNGYDATIIGTLDHGQLGIFSENNALGLNTQEDAISRLNTEGWATTSMTIEVWAKWTGTLEDYSPIAALWDAASTTRQHAVISVATGGLLRATIRGQGGGALYEVVTPSAYNDGAWHHIVATIGPNKGLTLYVDGREIKNLHATTDQEATRAIQTDLPFTVGEFATASVSFGFIGTVDEIAVYPSELSYKDISAHYLIAGHSLSDGSAAYRAEVISDTPVAYWRLGESIGQTTAVDQRNSYNGTYSPTPSLEAGGLIPNSGNTAAWFDHTGTGERVTMGDVLDFLRTEPFSLECLFRTSFSGGTQAFISKRQSNAPGRGYSLLLGSTGVVEFTLANTTTSNAIVVDTVSNGWNDGNPHHLAVTYDGSSSASGVKIYVDGALQSMTTLVNNLTGDTSHSTALTLGGQETTGVINPVRGTLDEVAIYDYVLTGTQVGDHFTASGL